MHDDHRPTRPGRRTRTTRPTVGAPLTMQDVLDAMLFADDRGILLCRDQLPADATCCFDAATGILWIDPRLQLDEWGRQLVDGIHHAADRDPSPRPALTLVVGDGPRAAAVLPRAAG